MVVVGLSRASPDIPDLEGEHKDWDGSQKPRKPNELLLLSPSQFGVFPLESTPVPM